MELFTNVNGVTYRNSALNHHDGIGVVLHHQLDNCFYSTSIEKVLLRVIVSWGGNHYKVGITVGFLCIEGSMKM